MRRRDFIALLGCGAATWPLVARAQQMPMVGLLSPRSPSDSAHLVTAFRRGLNETGYLEGKNVGIEYGWAYGQYDRLPALATELVRRPVAVLAAIGGTSSALAAKAATPTIAIVFVGGVDPVQAGLVASLNRPGGNVTGVSVITYELVPKRLELLREFIPNVTTIGLLVNPVNPTAELQTREVQEAARALGRQIVVVNASSEDEFETAFARLVQLGAGALLVAADHQYEDCKGARSLLPTLAARSRRRGNRVSVRSFIAAQLDNHREDRFGS